MPSQPGAARLPRIEDETIGKGVIVDFAEPVPGDLWVATPRAIARHGASGWHNVPIAGPLNGSIAEIAFDRDGTVWADGSFGGVIRLRLSGGKLEQIETVPFLASTAAISCALTIAAGSGWQRITVAKVARSRRECNASPNSPDCRAMISNCRCLRRH